MPDVQCARVWARVMLPHRRSLTGWRRMTRCFISSARVGSKRSFIVGTLRLGGIVASGPNNLSLCGEGLLLENWVQVLRLRRPIGGARWDITMPVSDRNVQPILWYRLIPSSNGFGVAPLPILP